MKQILDLENKMVSIENLSNILYEKEISTLENSINPKLFSLANGILNQLYPEDIQENTEIICEILEKNYENLKKKNYGNLSNSKLTQITYESLFEAIYADLKGELF